MNGDSSFRTLPLLLLVVSCFAGASSVRAQQSAAAGTTGAYMPGTGATSSAGILHSPGLYSSASTVQTGGSAIGIASRMGMTTSSATDETSTSSKLKGDANSRSAWLAGSSSIGSERSAGWKAGAGAFSAHTGVSWKAGSNSFGLSRQMDSIWRAMPASEPAPSTPTQEIGLSTPSSAYISPGLTAKGAALVKRAGLSAPFSSHQSTGFGFGRPGRASFSPRSGFGRTQNNFGSGIGSRSTQHTSSSESLTDPSLQDSGPLLNDNLPGNGGLQSPGNLRLGPDETMPGDSH
jgi:hypothetical protein